MHGTTSICIEIIEAKGGLNTPREIASLIACQTVSHHSIMVCNFKNKLLLSYLPPHFLIPTVRAP